MDIEKVIIEKGIARSMFATAWADELEENGGSFAPGTEILDVAPFTPTDAIKEAYRLTGHIEALNSICILAIINKAAKADGFDIGEMSNKDKAKYGEEFGHYLLMEAIGHGVSWFDDHENFDLKIPDYENPMAGHPSTMFVGKSLDLK